MAPNSNLDELSASQTGREPQPTGASSSDPISPLVTRPASPAMSKTARSTSLKLRIVAGFAAMTLAVALLMGIITLKLLSNSGITPEIANSLHRELLLWGFGAVVIAGFLGVVFARQISEPLRQLTEELQQQDFHDLAEAVNVRREFLELEQLSLTIRALASSVRSRDLEISASERKFREAFDLVGTGLTQIDSEGRFIAVNRRFCELLGYSTEELLGKGFSDIAHPDDVAFSAGMPHAAAPDSVAPVNRETRYIRKDGSIIWAQRSGVVVPDAEGKPAYMLGSIEDVSNYHASQAKLTVLNESLNAIVKTSPLAIYSLTLNGNVTLWNPAAERIFGVKEAVVLGRPSPIWANSQAVASDIQATVLSGESVHNVPISWTASEGDLREISLSAAPLRGPDNEVVGILVTASDVTDAMRTTRALDEQLHFTRELLEVIPSPIFYKGVNGTYLGFNRAWEAFFSKRREDWIGRGPEDLLSPEHAKLAILEDAKLLVSGETIAAEDFISDGRGNNRHIIRHISRFTNANGEPAGVIGVLTDFTDFMHVTQALEASEGRFKALTESAMDIVTVLDAQGVIVYQSPSVTHLLGHDPSEMIGRSQFDLIHRDDVKPMRAMFEELIAQGKMSRPIEFRVLSKTGIWCTLESIGKNCLDIPEVRGIIVNTRDISDRKTIQQRMQHLAYHDALTDLPNRSLMQDRISQAIGRAERSNKRFAVMFIDIDNFKNINDTLGHDTGDELLRQVARRLTDSVRVHDTIARQGGDEFIVLLDQLEGHLGATRVAQKILDALRAAFALSGSDQHMSGSIGIALYPDDGNDAPTLLKNADTAMFHGKAQGKNTYQFFTPQMNIAVKRRAAMESNLRAAVKNGDFSLVYQPQIDLNSGEIVALEALVRWVSMESGTIMPGEFIPLAEETGLISEIGEWVLREACWQAKKWLDAGLPPRRMAVNLSARQLTDKGFVELLTAILEETQLDPSLLELEITESQVMRQGEGSIVRLNEIAGMGIQLAVDDFGTGYSSLSYLKRLPISKLKIDQSFVRDITIDPNDTAIVVAIISMAKSLDLDIIAEGIETAGQLTLLRAKGCRVGQGFYFSVPMSAENLAPLLAVSSVFEYSPAVTLN
ncbi:MAG: EAL domain-containing protein [Betaproteobacteria bacterium]